MEESRYKIIQILRESEMYKYDKKITKMHQAETILDHYILQLKEKNKIAIWGAGIHTQFLLKGLSAQSRDMISCIIDSSKTVDKFNLRKNVISFEALEEQEIDYILVSSFKYREEIKKHIKQINEKYMIIDCYDLWNSNGITFEKAYYSDTAISYPDIATDLQLLEKAQDEDRSILVKKIIGNYFYIRDFKNAFKYIDYLTECGDSESPKYLKVKSAIQEVLGIMKNKIDGKEHIVINWLDDLRKDELFNMKFLLQEARKGINFNRAYTMASYTSATLKTMFTGKNFLDNELYKMKNIQELQESELQKEIEKNNYQFTYIGSNWNVGKFYNSKTAYFYSVFNPKEYIPSSLMQWELVCDLEESENKKIIIVHCIEETHPPYGNAIASNLKEITELEVFDLYSKHKNAPKVNIKSQIETAQRYLDEQFEFYFPLYNQVLYTVFMSDHGQYRGELPVSLDGRTNVVFFITGKSVLSRESNKVLSLQNFGKVIKYLLHKEENKIIENCTSEYALIQSDDVYGMELIADFVKNPEVFKMFYIQHRGVITETDSYIQYITGEEYYFRYPQNRNLINQNENAARIKELKEIAGNRFIDIFKEEKYRFARDLYKKLDYKMNDNAEFI